MVNFSLLENVNDKYVIFPFYKNNQPLNKKSPKCGITLRKAGSMRFRWNEENPVRNKLLSEIAGNNIPTPIQLNHTHDVFCVNETKDTFEKIGDGIITQNKKIMPVVTVADCVPIYLYDSVKKVFGIVHSGWKGTGIIVDAINLACKKYGSNIKDFSIVIGPHIHNCCYIVDKNRADFFSKNFSPDCIMPLEKDVKVEWNNGNGPLYRLSLKTANLAALKKAGILEENIAVCTDCTSCNEIYGSNRRETKIFGKPDSFTVQAAFVIN